MLDLESNKPSNTPPVKPNPPGKGGLPILHRIGQDHPCRSHGGVNGQESLLEMGSD